MLAYKHGLVTVDQMRLLKACDKALDGRNPKDVDFRNEIQPALEAAVPGSNLTDLEAALDASIARQQYILDAVCKTSASHRPN